MSLYTEWSGDLSSLVNVFLPKHLLVMVGLNDIASVRVYEVASLVNFPTLLINEIAIVILKDNYVTFLISVEIPKDIILIEVSVCSTWWNLN